MIDDPRLPERFWVRVKPNAAGCWIWTGSQSGTRYGRWRVGERLYATHRSAYEALVGPIADGMQIDHLCCVKLCCNPSHLEPVTAFENMSRRRAPVQALDPRRYCQRGHERTEANKYVRRDGTFTCRPCRIEYMREYNATRRAA